MFDAAYAQAPPPPGTGPGIPPGGPGTFPPPDTSQGTICGNSNCEPNENCAVCPQDCGQCSQTTSQTQSNQQTQSQNQQSNQSQSPCIELWQCSNWSNCTSGTKTRKCVDANNCSTLSNKPNETAHCLLEITNLTKNETAKTQNESNQSVVSQQPSASLPDKNLEPIPEQQQSTEKESGFKFSNATKIILVSTLSAAFLIVVLIVFSKRRKSVQTEIQETFGYTESAFNKLVDYIEHNLKLGYDIEFLKRKLVEAGHDISRIEKVIQHVIRKR